MFRDLKNNFFQISFGSTLWFALLISLFNFNQSVPFHYIWNVLLIGILFGIVFGIVYSFLWNYSTLGASVNILLSSLINTSCGILILKLLSNGWFEKAITYWYIVLMLTIVLHVVVFYFYSKHKNKQLAHSLSELTK